MKKTLILFFLVFGFLVVSGAQGASKAQDLLKKGSDAYQAKDYASTFKYFKQAADMGNPIGETLVGICYKEGVGVKSDPQAAVKWFQKSAKQKDPGGEFYLAQSYETGTGVEKNLKESISLYKKVAATDNENTEKATVRLIRLGVLKKPYEIIDEKDFDTKVLQAKGPVMVEYYATWCGPCHRYGPIVEDVAKEYSGQLKVVRLDLDECPGLSKKYGIESIPQTFLFKDGKLLFKWEGLTAKEDVEKNLSEKLDLKKAS